LTVGFLFFLSSSIFKRYLFKYELQTELMLQRYKKCVLEHTSLA